METNNDTILVKVTNKGQFVSINKKDFFDLAKIGFIYNLFDHDNVFIDTDLFENTDHIVILDNFNNVLPITYYYDEQGHAILMGYVFDVSEDKIKEHVKTFDFIRTELGYYKIAE